MRAPHLIVALAAASLPAAPAVVRAQEGAAAAPTPAAATSAPAPAAAGAAAADTSPKTKAKATAKAKGEEPRRGGGGARAAARHKRYATVELYSVNHKETLSLRLQDDRGRPMRGMQKRFNKFLRCHYTKITHSMHPRLSKVIYQ